MNEPNLTPTEDLIMHLLVARRRLGESMQDMPTRHMKALRGLQEHGLVNLHNRATQDTIQTTLTDRGLVLWLSPKVTARLEPETCKSFYIGPRSSEHQFYCDKKFGHRGKKHRYTAFGSLKKPLHWTDDEAGGRASERYGPEIRRHEAERFTRLTALVAELCPDASVDDFVRF